MEMFDRAVATSKGRYARPEDVCNARVLLAKGPAGSVPSLQLATATTATQWQTTYPASSNVVLQFSVGGGAKTYGAGRGAVWSQEAGAISM
jgi:hypothetical protein